MYKSCVSQMRIPCFTGKLRDEEYLLNIIEDGVKIFGNTNGKDESQNAERRNNKEKRLS
jgi:hypothetical protein